MVKLGTKPCQPTLLLKYWCFQVESLHGSSYRSNHQHRYRFLTTAIPKFHSTNQNSILDVYPKPSSNSAKWDRGHVAILAKKGAAVLAAHSALACGAGLVTLLVDEEDLPYLIGLRPEIILAKPSQLRSKRHDALVVGPCLWI